MWRLGSLSLLSTKKSLRDRGCLLLSTSPRWRMGLLQPKEGWAFVACSCFAPIFLSRSHALQLGGEGSFLFNDFILNLLPGIGVGWRTRPRN